MNNSEFNNCISSADIAGLDCQENTVLNINSTKFNNCTVTSENGKSAIRITETKSSKISNCVFTSCNGTALTVMKDKNSEIKNCTFESCVNGAVTFHISIINLKNCTFNDCASNEHGYPGAVIISESSGSITNSSFNNCFADSDGGAIKCMKSSNLFFENNTFKNCTATQGGAMSIYNSYDSSIKNCVFDYCNGNYNVHDGIYIEPNNNLIKLVENKSINEDYTNLKFGISLATLLILSVSGNFIIAVMGSLISYLFTLMYISNGIKSRCPNCHKWWESEIYKEETIDKEEGYQTVLRTDSVRDNKLN